MYDLPELREAHDAFWAGMAARLAAFGVADVPPALTRGGDLPVQWTDPRLLLGQTCGYPLVTSLLGKVALVATPCYAAKGCEGPNGRSAIIVRAKDPAIVLGDLRGRVCAVNTPDSNSGMNLLRAAVAPLAAGQPFFSAVIPTGAHTQSVIAVAEGEADVAAIDCVTWALLSRHRPALTARLRVLDWTEGTPWLPFITASATPTAERAALRETLRPDAALLIDGYVHCPAESYQIIGRLEHEAKELNYARLA